jgi:HK97 gp10 family phage protein
VPAKLTSRIPQVVAELAVRADSAARAGAELVERGGKARAPDAPPIGEGLVEAIHVERQGPARYMVVAGDDDVFYGHMVEHGTTHSAPHPFMVPAAEEARDPVRNLFVASLRNL